MATPSIKATGFQSAADDLKKLVETGRLSREEVEARLRADDFRYLDKQLAATTWVPIDVYKRVVDILVELEAGAMRPEVYLHNRGARAAERLHKVGIYRQFEASTETWGNRVGKIATTMATVLWNFTKWSFEMGSERGVFTITVDEALDFPDVARYTAQGYIEYTSRVVAGGSVRVTSERPTPSRVIFHGQRSK